MGHRRVRRSNFGVFSVCLLAFSAALPAQAGDETNREISKTFANFGLQEKDYPQVVSTLTDHLKQDPRDGSAWNLLGLTYLETRNLPQATKAFQEASSTAYNDSRGIYLYNYADALARGGDTAQARLALIKAGREDIVRGSANDALSSLKAGQPLPPLVLGQRPGSGNWTLGISLSSGYDSNVLLVSDASYSTVTSSGTASSFATTVPQIEYRKPLWGGEFDAKNISSLTYEINENARRFNTVYTGLNLEWGHTSGDALGLLSGIGNDLDVTYLNTDGLLFYNWNEAVSWTGLYRHNLHSETEFTIPLRYEKFAFAEGDDGANNRTGFGVRPSLVHRYITGAHSLTAGLQYEWHQALGINYRAHSLVLPLSYSRRIPLDLMLSLGAEGSWISYTESDTGRRDTGLKTSLTFSRRFLPSLSGVLDLSFKRNVSNVEAATYSRSALMVLVNYGIL